MPVKAFFGLFSTFFTDGKVAFTHTFVQLFTGSPKFSRTLFRIFSRVGFFFHGKEISNFRKFSRMAFFFTGTKIDNIHKGFFQIQNLQDFGRLKISDPDYDKRQ